jgi:hypothetical protein
MFFKKKSKEKVASLKQVSTKNLVVAECVRLIGADSNSYTTKHYSPKRYVLVSFSSTTEVSEKYYTDIFTGTDYYIGSNPFAEIGSVVVDNCMPLNIPYPYITYEQARKILQCVKYTSCVSFDANDNSKLEDGDK